MRFFCKSIRYSEDLDLDVRVTSPGTLKKNVNKILGSQNFKQALSVQGIEIILVSEAKQTDTTQRWKIQIQVKNSHWPLSTKIEFSRRQFKKDILFEPVDPEIIRAYKLYPVAITHYSKDEALRQKLAALLLRKETQARDVFDIHVLINLGADPHPLSVEIKNHISKLSSLTQGIHFDQFKSQVVAYLMPEQMAYYNSKESWAALRLEVVSYLKGLS